MLEYVIGVLGVIGTILAVVFKWLWSRIESNDDGVSELRTDHNTLEGRLYGNDRGQNGDVNELQGDVHEVKQELDKLDKIQHTIDQIRTDQVGDPDIKDRAGTLNEIAEMREQLNGIEDQMKEEHEYINKAIMAIMKSMDNPPEITYPEENPEEYDE